MMKLSLISSALFSNVHAIMDFPDLVPECVWPPVESEEGKPHCLNEQSLDKVMAAGDVLVTFHAPWCGHCVALEPEFEKASKMVHDAEISAHLATFDGSMYREKLKDFGLKGFPTIRWYTPHGDFFDYTGPRKASQISNWVKFMKVDPIKNLVKPPTPKGDKDRVHVTLVGPTRTPAFERVALKYRTEARWGFVEDHDGVYEPKIIVHKPNEEPSEMHDIESVDAVRDFFLRERLPTFGEMKKEEYPKYKLVDVGLVYVLFDHESSDDLDAKVELHMPSIAKLAKRWWDKFSFVYVNTKNHENTLRDSFGVKSFPAVAVTSMKDGPGPQDKWILHGDIKMDETHEFLQGIVEGNQRPNFKSEEIPEASDSPVAVQKIVGKSILSEVFRPDRDFFLSVYAPWCTHCGTTNPAVEKVGDKILDLGANHLIQVGNINGQLNDSPSKLMSWEHFPTLIYVKAGSDQKIVYEGKRDARSILTFVAENTEQKQLAKVICKDLARKTKELPEVCEKHVAAKKKEKQEEL